MVEGRGRLRFLEESLRGRFVAGQVRREQLDGDLALQARVLGRVDTPMPPWPISTVMVYGPRVAPGLRDME